MRSSKSILAFATTVALFTAGAPAMAGSAGGWTRTDVRVRTHDSETGFEFAARYDAKSRGNRAKKSFGVRVWNAEPLSLLDVSVNGLVVGQVSIGESGNGHFRIRERDMPELLSDFVAGDYVTVGDLGGAFTPQGRSKKSSRRDMESSRLKLRGGHEDETGLEIHAKYETRTRKGTMRRRFKVSMEFGLGDDSQGESAEGQGEDDGSADVSPYAGFVYPVLINGEYLGDIEIDESGEGKIDLRSRNGNVDSFPMLQAGDLIQVGDLAEFLLN